MKLQKQHERKQTGRAVKKSISMPCFLYAHADVRVRTVGFATFSDYVQDLIRKDGFTRVIA
jgi:Arc/MetJ-type ribon-helix-helix transcriptional regulator